MNPADFGMFWMNQYAQAQERMIMDESASYYAQPSIGMSVMDDIGGHQANSMDINPMGLVSEYTAATAPGPIAITPDLFGGLPRSLTATSLAHHHNHPFLDDSTHRTVLDHYGTLSSNGVSIGTVNVGTGTETYDEDDDDDAEDGQEHNFNVATQHHPYGTLLYDDNTNGGETGAGDDNSNECVDKQPYDDDDDDEDYDGYSGGVMEDSNNSNNIGFDRANANVVAADESFLVPFKRKTKGTQTNRKIKPVKRPGLVLKTPIAYQPCLDPSVIPIQRDGMAVCERCGAIGVKHSFYTKERRFCSMTCARGDFVMMQMQLKDKANQNPNDSMRLMADKLNNSEKTTIAPAMSDTNELNRTGGSADVEAPQLNATQLRVPNFRFKLSMNGNSNGGQTNNGNSHVFDEMDIDVDEAGNILYHDIMLEEELPQIPKGASLPSMCPQDEKIITVRRKPSEFLNSYDWSAQLSNLNFFAAPVTCFPHTPGYDVWSKINVGMKVEVENTDCDTPELRQGLLPHSFWVATVLRLCGYKALLRYEGFDEDNSHDFWVNLCSSEVHSVGWCAERGKPLIPPRTIENKYSNWKDYLVEKLSFTLTLPTTFYNKINESSKSRFRVGLQLEVVNKNRISQMRLATIHKIIGKRLLVRYYNAPDDNGFWVHEDSPLIHPVGWSIDVGHNLSAPPEYMERMFAGQDQAMEMHEEDATMDLFKMNFTFKEYFLEGKTSGFQAGMKLEAVDPLNLSSICVATVMDVLKFGYMMIRIDTYDPDATGADLFCYHEKSACIFPPGFCERNNIILTPPKGYDSTTFTWQQYLADTNSTPANEKLFCLEMPNNEFKEGMKIECADLMDPRLVCVATVVKIVGRVLRVHFDGWEDEFDQWLDAQSPDMYPVGWCVMVGHKLEAPKPQVVQKISPKSVKKGRRKRSGKFDGKGKPRSGTPTSLQTRNHTVKKEKEIFEQQKHNDSEERQNGNQEKIPAIYSLAMPKLEATTQEFDEDDDDFSHDGYSHSITSMQSTSLPPTPEPRTATPTQHPTRPSSKSSTFSVTSHNSTAATSSPPPERKATSYINNSSATSSKLIPRLAPGGSSSTISNITSSSFQGNSSMKTATAVTTGKSTISSQQQQASSENDLSPDTWNIYDVGQFLRVNDCTAHCETFSRNKVDGKRLLQLTNDEIVKMLSMKVGPALKIYDLIQQLKVKMKPSRHSTGKINVTKKYL